MGYSNSPQTLRNLLPDLAGMIQGQPIVRWRLAPGSTRKWAGRLREAKDLARRFPEVNPAFSRIAQRYKIYELADQGMVEARLISADILLQEEPSELTQFHRVSHDGALNGRKTYQPVSGPQTARLIISALLPLLPLQGPIHYPEANLSPGDLITLSKWVASKSLMVLHEPPDLALTVAPFDPEVAE